MSDDRYLLSVRAHANGIAAAAVDLTGQPISRAALDFQVAPHGPFASVPVASYIEGLRAVVSELATPLDSPPIALAITTPHQTAALVGPENEWLTPVLFGPGTPTSSRGVPAEFRTPQTALVYRNSVRHQLEHTNVEAALNAQRLVSLDAILIHAATGYWVCSSATPPTHAPIHPGTGRYVEDPAVWLACGFEKRFCPMLVPPGGIAAQVSPHEARRLAVPAGTPVVATGDELGCLAYGLKSNASAWVLWLGRSARAAWVAGSPREEYSIQVVEPNRDDTPATIDVTERSDLPSVSPGEAVDFETLSRVVHAGLEKQHDVRPGPRHDRFTYALQTADIAFAESLPTDHRPVDLADFGDVLVGSNGLRVLPGETTCAVVGLRPMHTAAHKRRAAFEGLCLELRRWRMQVPFVTHDRLRLVMDAPWSADLAQLACDIIGEPIVLWDGTADDTVLLGQALAALRDLGFGETAKPTLSLFALDPRPLGAEDYGVYHNLHDGLMQLFNDVLL